MYKSKKPYLYGTGRRKSSVARVHLFPNGTGAITINGRDIDDYFGLETLKLLVRQPLATTDTLGKVNHDMQDVIIANSRTKRMKRHRFRETTKIKIQFFFYLLMFLF